MGFAYAYTYEDHEYIIRTMNTKYICDEVAQVMLTGCSYIHVVIQTWTVPGGRTK